MGLTPDSYVLKSPPTLPQWTEMNSSTQKPPNVIRFGAFEADFSRLLLSKGGLRVKLQEQPFKLLGLLLERPGEIVSREEIRQALWSADTFVEFDDGLNTAIKKLRAALADSAENPRFIETVPRRGYRFTAPVARALPEPATPQAITSAEPQIHSQAVAFGTPRMFPWKIWAIAVAAIAVTVAGVWLMRRPHVSFKETDSVLLTDFVNSTGDPVLDGVLRDATAVELGQSPFLNIVSNDRVRESLRFMSRLPEDRVDLAIARQVCERVGAKAYISGSVARLGTGYVLAMQAVSCADALTFTREESVARNKDAVMPALDEICAKIRRKLGESLSSIRKFDVPIEEATTQSLESLKAYSLGNALRARGDEKDSIPLFDHALELDPNFAMAFLARAGALSNLGERERAATDIKRAYELRANLSERERLALTVRYADAYKSDTRKAIETYEVWHQLYPRDMQPLNGLAARYQIIGEYEKAVFASREALELRPDSYLPYANLASSYEALGRFEEAKQICSKALAAQRDSIHTHRVSFEIAFLQNDQTTMQREFASAKGTSREQGVYWEQGLVLAMGGKLRLARPFLEHSYNKRRENELDEFAAYAMAVEAQLEADFGFEERAKDRARQALKVGRGLDAEEAAAQTLALSGAGDEALALADDLHSRFPLHVPLNQASIPAVQAAVQIRRNNPAKAVQLLQQAIPYDFAEFADLTPVYVRGLAYLRMGAGAEAAAEFQKFVDHPGVNVIFPTHALAQLGLARAYVLMHDTAKARGAYDDFFARWSEADSDIPILQQAKAEYKKLN
jgi:eukaryotic-like serine/threonine-protein kinase